MRHPKKLWLALLLLIIILLVIFWRQFKRSLEIVTNVKSVSLISSEAIFVPITTKDKMLGNPGAPLTLIEFIDLSDKKSQALHLLAAKFVNSHPKEARLIWKDWPQSHLFGGDATLAHEAAYCAGEQDQKKFWQFLDAIIANKTNYNKSGLTAVAASLKLNPGPWLACLNLANGATIKNSIIMGQALGIPHPPALIVNNKFINLDEDFDLKKMLESFISQ